MNRVADRRAEIYDYFQTNAACQKYFYNAAHKDKYAAYCNSMYLLQDSTEALIRHRGNGFSHDPLIAYLEFWGVMQAAIIQQDSIVELYLVVVGCERCPQKKGSAWAEVRELRNICAGHPARRDRPKAQGLTRTFMGRNFGDYGRITYEQWRRGDVSHPSVGLGKLLDDYALEAEEALADVLISMKGRWK
jgi:hypothetical protein